MGQNAVGEIRSLLRNVGKDSRSRDQEDLNADIAAYYKKLRGLATDAIKDIYSRSHRATDLRGVPRYALITDVLRDRFGENRVEKFFKTAGRDATSKDDLLPRDVNTDWPRVLRLKLSELIDNGSISPATNEADLYKYVSQAAPGASECDLREFVKGVLAKWQPVFDSSAKDFRKLSPGTKDSLVAPALTLAAALYLWKFLKSHFGKPETEELENLLRNSVRENFSGPTKIEDSNGQVKSLKKQIEQISHKLNVLEKRPKTPENEEAYEKLWELLMKMEEKLAEKELGKVGFYSKGPASKDATPAKTLSREEINRLYSSPEKKQPEASKVSSNVSVLVNGQPLREYLGKEESKEIEEFLTKEISGLRRTLYRPLSKDSKTSEKTQDVTPPGREKQVRALKKRSGITNPWAVSWASYNKSH